MDNENETRDLMALITDKLTTISSELEQINRFIDNLDIANIKQDHHHIESINTRLNEISSKLEHIHRIDEIESNLTNLNQNIGQIDDTTRNIRNSIEVTNSENNRSLLFTIFLTTGLSMVFIGAEFINSFYSENRIYEMSSAVLATIPNASIPVAPSSSLHDGGTCLIIFGLIFMVIAAYLPLVSGIFRRFSRRSGRRQ